MIRQLPSQLSIKEPTVVLKWVERRQSTQPYLHHIRLHRVGRFKCLYLIKISSQRVDFHLIMVSWQRVWKLWWEDNQSSKLEMQELHWLLQGWVLIESRRIWNLRGHWKMSLILLQTEYHWATLCQTRSKWSRKNILRAFKNCKKNTKWCTTTLSSRIPRKPGVEAAKIQHHRSQFIWKTSRQDLRHFNP